MAAALKLERPGDDDALPVVVLVQDGDGGWTPGPCASIECGNVIEMRADELQWLIEDAGPQALARLRELAA